MSKPVVLFTNDLIDLMIGLFAFIIPSPGRGGRRLSKVQRGLLVVSGRAVNNVSGAAPAGSEMELRRAAAPNCTPANLLRWSKNLHSCGSQAATPATSRRWATFSRLRRGPGARLSQARRGPRALADRTPRGARRLGRSLAHQPPEYGSAKAPESFSAAEAPEAHLRSER